MGLDANGDPITPGSGNSIPLSADFDSLQANIFTPICSVCHVGGGAPQGLRLDAADSYNLLVGVPSTEVPSILRVKASDPDNSYIIMKLEGHAAVGAQMPLGGPYLSTATIAFIRQWITNGAPPSASAAAAASRGLPLTVVASAPATGDVMNQPPPQIMVGFNQELDATRIDDDSARIERLPSDADSAAERVAAHIAVRSINLRAMMLGPTQPLAPGRYRVLLSGSDGVETLVSSFEVEASP
jgi:hypothetical protein